MDTPVAAAPEQQVYGLIPLWVNGNIVTRATLIVLVDHVARLLVHHLHQGVGPAHA